MNTVFRKTVFALSILLPVLFCLFLAAPLMIDSYILPELLKTTGPVEKKASLTRLTPFSVQGFLRFEQKADPVLSIPYIKIGFSPGQLLKRRFSYVRVDHATIHLHKTDGGYRVRGFAPDETTGKSNTAGLAPLLMPLAAERLILKECSLLLHQDGMPQKRLTVSADLALNFRPAKETGYRLESFSGTFHSFDITAASGNIAVSFSDSRIEAEIEMEADRLPVGALSLPESLHLNTGRLNAAVRCTLARSTLSLERLNAEGSISGVRLAKTDLPNANLRVERDVVFSVSGSPGNLEYSIGPVAVVSPVAAEFTVAGTGSFDPSDLSTEGKLELRLLPEKPLLAQPLQIASLYHASFTEAEGWQIDVDSGCDRETKLSTDTMRATVSPFEVHASFRARETVQSKVLFEAPLCTLTVNSEELDFTGGSFSSTVHYANGSTAAQLRASVARISLPSKKLMFENIDLDLPIVYPFPTEQGEQKGSIAIAGVYLKNTLIAELFGTISQERDSWKLAGDAHSKYLQDSGLELTAHATPLDKSVSFGWKMDRTEVASERLPPFVKIPENISFNGLGSTQGSLLFHKGALSGDAAFLVENGVIEIGGGKGRIQGLNCSLAMNHLPQVVSSPSQHCRAESISFGTTRFTDIDATFRIDGPDTIFIEKSRAGWCRGSLESTSLVLSLADKKIDTVLYCSRINFADLLNQFGLDQAEGEGSVNGKLPVHFSKSGLRFDDGFLFSTPGTGGIVKFSDTDMLRQGIGSVDAGGYLEYSMEAMEDFSYNWTKLSFNSVGEELLLTMQLDGKPRTPLPYKFKNGKITNASEGDGMQYPIRLDVNFRLPLDDLFRVGQNINTIRENM